MFQLAASVCQRYLKLWTHADWNSKRVAFDEMRERASEKKKKTTIHGNVCCFVFVMFCCDDVASAEVSHNLDSNHCSRPSSRQRCHYFSFKTNNILKRVIVRNICIAKHARSSDNRNSALFSIYRHILRMTKLIKLIKSSNCIPCSVNSTNEYCCLFERVRRACFFLLRHCNVLFRFAIFDLIPKATSDVSRGCIKCKYEKLTNE